MTDHHDQPASPHEPHEPREPHEPLRRDPDGPSEPRRSEASASPGSSAGASSGSGAKAGSGPQRHTFSIKETLISIMIAFIMAFVFRAFVIEAFRIPTGSMAPTLMGAHTRYRGPMTGATWQVGPWQENRGVPAATQNVVVHDPNLVPYPGMAGLNPRRKSEATTQTVKPILSGDRILVFKYLPPLLSPERFDISVFKYPGGPQEAYIKRLIGLPGEQVALVDGDVFVRTLTPRPGPDGVEIWGPTAEELNQPGGTWDLTGWEIARKPERVQREVWQPVYDAALAPRTPLTLAGARWFSPPWTAQGAGWEGLDGRSYTYSGDRPSRLSWDNEAWPIGDWYPYNETHENLWNALAGPTPPPVYTVGDVRLRMGFSPQREDVGLTLSVTTRQTEFRARIEGRSATLQMRPKPTEGDAGGGAPWEDLETVEMRSAVAPGQIVDVEFWHVDQSLSLYVDGKRIAHKPYYWNPSQRIANAMGMTAEEILASETHGSSPIHDARRYWDSMAQPEIHLTGPATLHRVAVDRDIFYQPGVSGDRINPLRGAHPRGKLVILNRDQFFTLGDNSPSSSDGRMWESVDPWVAEVDPTPGIVPRSLMVGRAFFVYFPSLHKEGGPLMAPDFGRLRFLY